MRSAEYWKKRIEAVANLQHRKTDEYIATTLKREYEAARRSIQRDIDVFYARFAKNNEISLSEARKHLSSDELDDFKMGLAEFTRLAKNNPDGRWTQKLNNASYKVRVSRLEALQLQIEAEIQRLNMAQNEQLTELLTGTYTDTYYRTMYEIQKGIGMGTNFAKLDNKTVERIVKTPWLEQNYSQRIWGDNARLVRQLETEITQAFIRGDGAKRTAEVIADRMGVGYRNAQRLVITEMAHMQSEATFKSYKESGVVQKYEFLASLDERTCDICGPMDGKIFTLAEKEVGVNYAPLHPRCRCDSVPYFDDEIDVGERAARGDDGKTYYVPGNMTYEQWEKAHVKG